MNQNILLNIAAFTPDLLQSPREWMGHLPFAAWIAQDALPKIFVDFGSHYGYSYFSFCQLVVEADLSTKCYAVDTWCGDEHAGQHNGDIFNDAVVNFSDKSIELLHIDGLHTYEVVRYVFETWLPKLAPGAVVKLRDANVRERGYGVYKFWEELKARYPNNLEFVHSHSLEVLQPNNAPDGKLLDWQQANSPGKQRLINYYAALGSQRLEYYELN